MNLSPTKAHWLLIVTDAKTKWLEVIPVPNTTSASTVRPLHTFCAHFGLPQSLESDNKTGFCSVGFAYFLQLNGITHIRVALYHLNSNGLAESAV